MGTSPQRGLFFGTNLKMHQTPAESRQFLLDLSRRVGAVPGAQLFVIPPFTSLPGLAEAGAGSGIWVGAQNMHWEDAGAYTGEISPAMLRAVGVDLVLLGHAERRRYFNETDYDLHKKASAALRSGLRVLLCVGDSAEERQFGAAREVVARQLRIALYGLPSTGAGHLMIAYEPVWSIGEGGRPAAPEAVDEMMGQIRITLRDMLGHQGDAVPVLYGGSVDSRNCRSYARLPGVDGLFVGRAAWSVDGFVEVLQQFLAASPATVTD